MKQNPFEKIIEAYESEKKDRLNRLRQDVGFEIYELTRTLPEGEKIEANASYTFRGRLVVEPGQAYLKDYYTIVGDTCRMDKGRQYDEMRDKPLSKILALMDDHAVLSVAKEISSYLGRKEWEKEQACK